MPQTRSQSASRGHDWPVVGTVKEVRIPAPAKVSRPISPPSPSFTTTDEVIEDELPALSGNAPSQRYALNKVFCKVRQIFITRLALDITSNITSEYSSCLHILEALRATATDFITNYNTEGWVTIIPCMKVNFDDVHYVLREIFAIACQMAREDELCVIAHAAGWGLLLFRNRGHAWGMEYCDGSSEVHEGIFEFVRWIFV